MYPPGTSGERGGGAPSGSPRAATILPLGTVDKPPVRVDAAAMTLTQQPVSEPGRLAGPDEGIAIPGIAE